MQGFESGSQQLNTTLRLVTGDVERPLQRAADGVVWVERIPSGIGDEPGDEAVRS